tara:strand:+ start:67 stop:1395 length:1329 start_codon:yes stop_codon:yes gene_type:complete
MPNSKLFSKKISFDKLGEILFLIGIFFLCSSLFVSSIFLITSFVIGSIIQCKKSNYFKDKWNFPFLLCGLLILLNSLIQRFILPNDLEGIWDPNLSLIGMANWIPFFWIFWACQPFINSKAKRKKFALILISGTLPLLITGFGQFFFEWTGPFETLKGLIIWYQRPIDSPGGLSGLFSNQNYAGSWLNLVWPFCIALTLENTKNLVRKSTAICFLISIGFAIFLTYSRNAWTGLLITLPILIAQESLFWIIVICMLFTAIIFFLISPIFYGDLQNLLKELIPNRIILEFSKEGYKELDATRIEILKSALKIMNIRPLVGVGAASFTVIYELQSNFYKGHSHNLFTELAISYGLPVTIIFILSIIYILVFSYFVIFLKDLNSNKIDFFDKACWASVFFFFLSQLVDIQYFDGKISIIIWILLATLKKIIEEQEINIDIRKISL